MDLTPIVVGQTYGSRTVVAEAPPYVRANGYSDRRWACVCKQCGLKQDLPASEIRTPQGSCCRRCRNRSRRKVEAPFKRVLDTYKRNAQKRGLEWGLSENEARNLFASSCHYCGTKPSNFGRPSTTASSDPQPDRGFVYSGLDRKDNTIGYKPENVVSCCRTCNWAKGKHTYDEFFAWLDRVAAFRCRGVTWPTDSASR